MEGLYITEDGKLRHDMVYREDKVYDNLLYREDRSHLPEHAKAVLEAMDEVWYEKVKEYNDTKHKYVRITIEDEEGNEIVTWKEKDLLLNNNNLLFNLIEMDSQC